MRKTLIFILYALCIHFAYTDTPEKIKVSVSIMPQKFFVEQIGGSRVDVTVLVPPGTSPENFDPSPRQIVQLGNSDIYFPIGIPFENIFLDKLKNGRKKVTIADCGRDVPRLRNPEDEHEHGETDPHIWTDPLRVKIIARNMADALIEKDSANAAVYTENLRIFSDELDRLEREIRQELAPYKGRIFYVYHSAYTYFAERFSLVQKSIETGEKEPAPAQLRNLVNQAREDRVKTIFIQPEFPASGARRVAEAIGGRTADLSVLEYSWADSMRNTARLLVESFEE